MIRHTNKDLMIETIGRFLISKDEDLRKRALRACIDDRVPAELIEIGLGDKYPYIQRLAAEAYKSHEIPMKVVNDWLTNGGWSFRSAALYSCCGREVPLELIERGLADKNPDVQKAAIEACKGRDIPMERIDRWLKIDNWNDLPKGISARNGIDFRSFRIAALLACRGQDVALSVIARGLTNEDVGIRKAAIEACRGRNIPMAIIEECLRDDFWSFRAAAFLSFCGRETSLELIEKGLDDMASPVQKAAMEACRGRDIPMEIVSEWLHRWSLAFRRAASYSCYWRRSAIEDYDPYLLRSFEPPTRVYDRCEKDVIVVAEIPKDAYVKADDSALDGCCRASKAKIVDVIDDHNFGKAGIPRRYFFDFYLVGDEIEVEEFLFSDAPISESFHFFRTQKEARDAYHYFEK